MKAERGLWFSALTGAVAFLALTGGAILDPARVDWLLTHPDIATTYLGWAFFRQAPFLQWPYGANPAYGLEIGSSVVYSDSVPLLALALKPFSPLLPAAFQYLGAWLLACFVLQAVFAYRLLRGFSENQILCWIGAAFFLAAPAWLFRLSGHFALFGQWVVLAALCLYFTPRPHPGRWIALLCAAVLIHFYLFVMAGAVWLADALQRRGTRFLFPVLVFVPCVMWAAGYFMIGASGSALPGYGIYRMNLAAPFDGNGLFSRVVPDIPGAGGDFEGFNYLGLGMLLLAPLALWKRMAFDRRLMPLLAAGLILTLLALSNRVALGPIELFGYDVPGLLRPYTDLLRGSGRLFWPMYYLVLLAILVAVFRGFPARIAMAVCGVALVLQLADSGTAFKRLRDVTAGAAWRSPLQHPVWQDVASRYKRVIYVLAPPQSTAYSTFLPWAAFAAQHDMAVNFGYFARVDAERAIEASQALETAVRANRLDPDSLYVFWDDPLWRLASSRRGAEDLVGEIDGYRVIAPGLRDGSAGNPARSEGTAPAGAPTR